MALREVASEDDLWIGEMGSYAIDGKRILVVRTDDGVYAYEDRCPHLGLPLSSGRLLGNVLTCGAHGYSFDVRSGEGVNPRRVCLRSVPVRIVDGKIAVDAAGTSSAAREISR